MRVTAGTDVQRRRWLQWAGVCSLGGAAAAASSASAPVPRIVASFSILADITQALAPAGAEVSALVGPNADAHVFEPTPSAARRLAAADLVVTNGLGFEGWIDRLIRISGFKGTTLVASRGLRPRMAGRGLDPHAWQDLANARLYVANISAALQQLWPQQAPEIEQRRLAYLAQIDALDRQVRLWLQPIPRERRRVITSHDAFGYFGDAYGIDFFAPQGWNTDSEPSAAAVARLIRQIRDQGVRALFVENISSRQLVAMIAKEGGVQLGGSLYSDALSGAQGPASTYLKMFEHNARALAEALARAA